MSPRAVTATTATTAGMITPAAEQVLADRFARGEIDADEYRDRLGVLRS